ncbi:MAG: hypothetical protein Q9199_006302 [Rusavskia elegans]
MQIKSIVAFVSLAVMAAAAPAENLVARTTGQDVQNQCSSNQKAKCCNKLQKGVAGLIPILIGIQCVDLNLLLDLGGQCSQKSSVACCSSGSQSGLVNIGNVCVPVTI